MKDTTKDIDLVVTTEVAFDRLLAALENQGYEEVPDLDETYQQSRARLCVENDDGCRIDVFNRQVANKLIFSDGMQHRSEEEPMSVEAIAEEHGLDWSHVEEQLRRLEAYGYVEEMESGFVDTGKRDEFDE